MKECLAVPLAVLQTPPNNFLLALSSKKKNTYFKSPYPLSKKFHFIFVKYKENNREDKMHNLDYFKHINTDGMEIRV